MGRPRTKLSPLPGRAPRRQQSSELVAPPARLLGRTQPHLYKIIANEHTSSTHAPKTGTKRTQGTLKINENAQVRTGAPPGT
jgi:hypothetical protein